MKKSLFLSIAFYLLLVSTIKAQHFLEQECGIVANSAYHLESYTAGSHAYGVRLYHNGVVILDQTFGYEGGCGGSFLKFLNDTTGFVVINCGETPNRVFTAYKIIGNHLISIGSSYGTDAAFYIVNAYTAYLAVSFYYMPLINFNRCSDVHPKNLIIYDTSATADITVTDTIIGKPLCDSLSEINCQYNGINYKIKFYIIDSAYSVIEHNKEEINIFPNPSSDKINIHVQQQFGEIKTLEIFDCIGQLQFVKTDNFSNIDISSLTSGLYFIVLTNFENKRLTSKILKE
jgi:hypothetical protein